MPLQLNEIAPYRSLQLSTCPGRWRMGQAVEEISDIAGSLKHITHIEPATGNATRHGIQVDTFYYKTEQAPSWLLNVNLLDVRYELVVVLKRRNSVALLATEARLRDKIREKIGSRDGTELGKLTALSAGTLNAAFVQGKINALWLSGIHPQVPSLADNKAISGPDLRYAIDPLGDQSFFFKSAVSQLPNNAFDYKIGVSPHRSYIWAGPSSDVSALCKSVGEIFDIVANRSPQQTDQLSMLASPTLDAASIATVADAYDVALIPSELLDYDLLNDKRERIDRWSRLVFDVTSTNGANFKTSLLLVHADGTEEDLGEVSFAMNLSDPSRIGWTASVSTQSATFPQEQKQALDIINSCRGWLKVLYESGHTLVNQKFFSPRLRAPQFDFCFADFSTYELKTEKPSPFEANTIGAQQSLFCWTRQRWHRALPLPGTVSGWLACNDGAMEIADFIHFDVVNNEPELTLIHVKAAKCGGLLVNRKLSVSDYEIVVGQAVKNLRFLDLQNTLADFTTFLSAKLHPVAWQNGQIDTRANMIAAMRAARHAPKRRVVIVQPRVRQTLIDAARVAPPDSQQAMISKQLDTLLCAARANCQNLGANFVVIVDET